MFVDLGSIRAAHERIRLYMNHTPMLTSSRLDEASGASLFFKCEHFQKVGAFKARGATNAVFSLDDVTAPCGVATHSSGNHGAALARSAKLRAIPAHIVMPSNSAKVKVRAVESYGAHIVFCEPTEAARESACADVIAKTGATLIHSFENEVVIAGQGTAAVELLEDVPDVDLVICPVGGDVGAPNFVIIQRYVDDIVTVSEEAIVLAMRTIWETMKIVIEPSAAVPYAAILESKIDIEGKRVGIILTGGNVDLDALPWMRMR